MADNLLDPIMNLYNQAQTLYNQPGREVEFLQTLDDAEQQMNTLVNANAGYSYADGRTAGDPFNYDLWFSDPTVASIREANPDYLQQLGGAYEQLPGIDLREAAAGEPTGEPIGEPIGGITDPTVPAPTGDFDTSADPFLQSILDNATQVYGLENPPLSAPLGLPDPLKTIATYSAQALEAEKPIVQEQARRAGETLKFVGQQTSEFIAALDTIQNQVSSTATSSAANFDAVVAKAEAYASDASTRTSEGLAMIDQWGQEIYDKLTTGKAHDLQVAVQSTIDASSEGLRNIEQQFGADSAEASQYRLGLGRSFQIAQSTIQAAYEKNLINIGTNLLNTKTTFMDKSNMYESFQQQQDVEISAAMAQAEQAMMIDFTKQSIALEQFKMAGWENLANWVLETPVFSIDTMETVAFMGQLAVGQMEMSAAAEASQEAADAARDAGRSAMWGSIGGAILGSMI